MTFVKKIKSFPDYIGAAGRSEEEITEAEKVLGLSFATDYRAYLKEVGLACFDGHELTGLTKTDRLNVVTVTKEQRSYWSKIAESWYVVEEAYIDGIVIWQSSDGTVYQTMPDSECKPIAKNLLEYISE